MSSDMREEKTIRSSNFSNVIRHERGEDHQVFELLESHQN
jgi:hypothetical protein